MWGSFPAFTPVCYNAPVHPNSLANLRPPYTSGAEGTGTLANEDRWNRARDAATAGLVEALQKETPEEAWREVMRNQASLAADPEKRGSTQAARLVGQAADMLPRTHQQADSGGNNVLVQIDAREAEILLTQVLTEEPVTKPVTKRYTDKIRSDNKQIRPEERRST
jgi:hypothetical protein